MGGFSKFGGKGQLKGSAAKKEAPPPPKSGSVETKVAGLKDKSKALSGANGSVGTLSFKGVQQDKGIDIHIAAQGWNAYVSASWLNDRIAQAGAANLPTDQLQACLGLLSAARAAVSTYFASPGLDTAPPIAALGNLANQLGPGLDALRMGSPGATSSWANSDETPIHPGPDKTSRKGGLAGLARFGKMMAGNSLAKMGSMAQMNGPQASAGGPAKGKANFNKGNMGNH